MINVSDDFKYAMHQAGKKLKAYLDDGSDEITGSDDLKTLHITANADILRTVMRQADAEYFGVHSYLDSYVNLGIGVVLPFVDDLGTFTVTIASPAIVSLTAHGLVTGALVKLSTSGTLPTGLTPGFYYVVNLDESDPDFDNKFQLAASYQDAINGVVIDTSGSQGGTHNLKSYPYGEDGDPEYIDYGTFKVIKQESNESADTVKITMVDKMWESLKLYDLDLSSESDVSVGTATITIATPAVVTKTAHGLLTGQPVHFTTTGALPTGLVASTDYFAVVIDANTFNLATTLENAQAQPAVLIATTGSQSGTHTLFATVTDTGYPIELGDFLQEICDRFSWTLGTPTFPNDDLVLNSDVFSDQLLTYRNVLDAIAEAAGSIMYFNADDELTLRQVENTILDTLDSSTLRSLSVQAHFGPINSIVLSRQPQNDDILAKDQTSIDADGLTELKIVNNLAVDSDRETYASPILDALNGIEFYPFDATTHGLAYFELGDMINVKDPVGNTFQALILFIELKMGSGLSERLKADIPEKTNTDYNKAGIVGQLIKNTQISVDKQKQQITLISENLNTGFAQINLTNSEITSQVSTLQAEQLDINDQIEVIQGDITTLQQTAEGLTLSVEGIGGVNLLKNSVGLKTTFDEWQLFDLAGDLIDSRNNATIDQSTDTQNNTESGSAFVIANQFLEQTVPTIIGETCTLYLRYKNTLDLDITITGVSGVLNPTISATYDVFKYQFVATSNTTTIRYENGSGATAFISDSVLKLGDVTGWIQAPNEVYGATYAFGKDGLKLTDSNSNFKKIITNDSDTIYDSASGSDVIASQFTKDAGLISNLTVQNYLILQRRDNAASAVRAIATATGLMIVVND
jgi:hypothetical protein